MNGTLCIHLELAYMACRKGKKSYIVMDSNTRFDQPRKRKTTLDLLRKSTDSFLTAKEYCRQPDLTTAMDGCMDVPLTVTVTASSNSWLCWLLPSYKYKYRARV